LTAREREDQRWDSHGWEQGHSPVEIGLGERPGAFELEEVVVAELVRLGSVVGVAVRETQGQQAVDDGVREGIARGESSHLQAIVEEALSERGESDVWRNGRSKTFGAELSKSATGQPGTGVDDSSASR